jgi:c(7)-type cytochrome triheme protein
MTLLRLAAFAVLALVVGPATAGAQSGNQAHPPLGTEGIYDPANPGLPYLQQPAEALGVLPPAPLGNRVDWVAALNQGLIEPRMGIDDKTIMRAIEMNVQMSETASMPYVTFPHYTHSQHLACSNCHTAIFLPKKNANPVDMYSILRGEYCGVCHGKVAFPLTDCFRCHNTPRDRRILAK